MTRRPRPITQLSLDLNAPLPDVMVPDEAVQVLAHLLLEAVGVRLGVEQAEDGREPQDHP
jgi:hypothetical protein